MRFVRARTVPMHCSAQAARLNPSQLLTAPPESKYARKLREENRRAVAAAVNATVSPAPQPHPLATAFVDVPAVFQPAPKEPPPVATSADPSWLAARVKFLERGKPHGFVILDLGGERFLGSRVAKRCGFDSLPDHTKVKVRIGPPRPGSTKPGEVIQIKLA